MARKTVIHVNQHVIKANAVHGTDDPPLTVKDYRENRRAFTADILDAAGNVVASVVNRPHDPLSCGARVWIETRNEVRVVTSRDDQGDVSDDVSESCSACGAETGEECRAGCLGVAQREDSAVTILRRILANNGGGNLAYTEAIEDARELLLTL